MAFSHLCKNTEGNKTVALFKREKHFSVDDSLAIKGIAIILLLFHHLFRVPALYSGYDVNFLFLDEEFVSVLFTYFKVCVGIFAFISGFGLSKSYKKSRDKLDTGRFVLKRYIKSFSPFWVVYIIAIAVTESLNGKVTSTYFEKSDNFGIGIVYMLLDFLGLRSFTATPQLDSSWWYLGTTVMIILFVPLFVNLLDKIGWLPLTAAIILLPRLIGVQFQGGTAPFSFLAPAFFGILFEHYNIFDKIDSFRVKFFRIDFLERILTFLLFAACVFIGFKYYEMVPQKILWEISYGVVPVTLICFLNRYVVIIPFLKNVLKFLGKHSANMYFIHTLIRSYIRDFLYEKPNFIVTFCIFFVITLGVSIALELLKRIVMFLIGITYNKVKERKKTNIRDLQ